MKKLRFSFFVMAVLAAVCFTACTNKDDDSNDQKSTIVPPKYKGKTFTLKFDEPVLLSNNMRLHSFELTESGRAYLEVEDVAGKKTFYNANFKIEDGKYVLSGNVEGTIEDVTVRSESENVQFKVNITIKTNNSTVIAQTTSDAAINAVKTVGEIVGDVDIISSWSVRGIMIDVTGDYTFSKDFPDGDLKKILNYAKTEHHVEFTEKEEKELSKVIQYVSVSTKHVTIDYADGTSDVADWDWAGSVYDKVNFVLKEHDMGNKFIVSDPAVKIEFNKPKAYLNIVFSASITGEKNYDASLRLLLAQKPEFIPAVD